MWFPEEPVTYCPNCDIEIPAAYYWRTRGVIISATGHRERTPVLNSLCPGCGEHRNVGLEGGWLYRLVYRYLWQLRYPRSTPPQGRIPASRRRFNEDDLDEDLPRRRATG